MSRRVEQDEALAELATYGGAIPRLLSARLGAWYMSLSESNFIARVAMHELPNSRRIGSRVLWDRRELDEYIDVLFDRDSSNSAKGNFFGD